MATSTIDGSLDPLAQAEPVEQAIPSVRPKAPLRAPYDRVLKMPDSRYSEDDLARWLR